MPFVNEYVSDEDAQKYDLDNVSNKYYYSGLKMPELLNHFDVHQHAWCVDKERGYWLFYCDSVMSDNSRSGYAEPTNKEIFILHVNGQNIEFILARLEMEDVSNLYPIHFAWGIVSMAPSCLPNMSRERLLTILKEALSVYKCSGIRNLEENAESLIGFDF